MNGDFIWSNKIIRFESAWKFSYSKLTVDFIYSLLDLLDKL